MINSFSGYFSTVVKHGQTVPSRFGSTIEMPQPLSITFDAGDMVSRRGINYDIGWIELLQLVAGIYEPQAFARVAPNANLELFTSKMAYGPRIRWQMIPVIEALRIEPNTRQAVVFIGHPDDGPTSDLPCTISIQFLRRASHINASVSMRSWDLVKGMAYDVMMFGGLTQVVANCLGLLPGKVTVTAGSAHIYESEIEFAPKPLDRQFKISRSIGSTWFDYVVWAAEQSSTLERHAPIPGIQIHKR